MLQSGQDYLVLTAFRWKVLLVDPDIRWDCPVTVKVCKDSRQEDKLQDGKVINIFISVFFTDTICRIIALYQVFQKPRRVP